MKKSSLFPHIFIHLRAKLNNFVEYNMMFKLNFKITI